MLKNYLLISFRNIIRQKSYSLINIVGLAIGIACFLLIMLWVDYETGYDSYHEKIDQIHILCLDAEMSGTVKRLPITNGASGPALAAEFPEIVNATRMESSGKMLVQHGAKQLQIENSVFADNEYFNIFTYRFIEGDRKTALAASKSVVLTESVARKLFGDENAIGQEMKVDGQPGYKVTGVMVDVPEQSFLQNEMLISYKTLLDNLEDDRLEWLNFNRVTFLLLEKNSDIKALEAKFPGFIDSHFGETMSSMGIKVNYFTVPLSKLYFYSGFDMEVPNSGNLSHVYIFSGIAIFILMIACFNFINLSTARSASRAKEVGIRKTCGAERSRLIGQFLGESILYSVISLLIALVILEIVMPFFTAFTEQQIELNYLTSPLLLATFAGITLIIGFLAGFYPAIYMSSFMPSKVLKTSFKPGGSILPLRRILVVLQFMTSIILIIATLTIYFQIDFMKEANLGFKGDQVLVIPSIDNKAPDKIDILAAEFKQINGVVNATVSNFVPGGFSGKSAYVPEGYSAEQSMLMDNIEVDYNYFETLDIQLIDGRNFTSEFVTDSSSAVIINETAAKRLGWENPIGKIIYDIDMGDDNEMEWNEHKVIGVVKDFHTGSLHSKIEPAFIGLMGNELDVISLKLSGDDISGTVNRVKTKWEDLTGGQEFDFYFLDDFFNNLYIKETKLSMLTVWFSALAVFLGCLGLYGLSAYAAEKRTKEIGIRKVLGASLTGIITLLSREFIILVGVANLISWPIAYFALDKWLANYAYRIEMPFSVFVFTAILSIAIAITTIFFQAFKAARTNPVDIIRYE